MIQNIFTIYRRPGETIGFQYIVKAFDAMQSHKHIAFPHNHKLDVHMSARDIIVRRNSLTLQGDNFARRVHDGGVGGDRPPDRVGRVGHVDDDHLGSLAHLLPHANVPGKRGGLLKI